MKRFFNLSVVSVALVALLACSFARSQEPVNVEPTVADGMKWFDATQWPVENKGWNDVARYFDRLPSRAEGVVTGGTATLSDGNTVEITVTEAEDAEAST